MRVKLFLYASLIIAFLSSGLLYSVPQSYAALTPTTCTLSAPTTSNYGQAMTVSFTLDNQTSATGVSGAYIQFSVQFDAGSSQSIGTANTASNGVASISYTPQAIGTYVFSGTYGGDTNYAACTPSTATTKVSYSSGWGQIYTSSNPSQYVNAELASTSGTWNATTPTYFQTTNQTASATFSYAIYDLTSFDMSERSTYGIANAATTPTFNWNHTFTLQIAGYTFEDTAAYTNGFYGVGSTSTRDLITTFPNGTTVTNSLSSQFNDYVRFVFYYDIQGYYMLVWTLTPYPGMSLAVGTGPIPSAFQVNTANPLDVNMSLSFTSSAGATQTFGITLNSISLSAGETEAYSLDSTTAGSGGFSLLGAIGTAFQNGALWIANSISTFFTKTIWGGFINLLNSLGVGWLLQAFGWFIDAILVLFVIVEATLPYLGFIIILLNMFYIVKLDFAGLFNFYISIYQVVSIIVNLVVNVIQTIIDFIQGLTSGGGGAALAAAGA